ncbi:MAG: LLM class flavin-dependent oxidoreductase [Candidatus Heimdallarchaeota archaeon]|nr:LLM class flavin-dependent oxidoreductase [Candidatus Heimdallarchaeota archaeon]MCK4770993.1 LLM class flavin-dependent oxidoreductase [Candidatus Heimdallarchaeota archaeon]
MKFGLYAPNFGNTFGDPLLTVSLFEEAELAGWDGFFLWDHIFYPGSSPPIIDPFTTLAAAAVNTKKLIIGTTVTAVPRRRPWKLARECVTLDHLSNGRFILGIGLGDPEELRIMNEETDPKKLAEMANEQIEILEGLWKGEEFSYKGRYYSLDNVKFLPKPVQQPRIKLWGAGTWPNKGPFRRASRLDGVIPLKVEETITTDDCVDIIEYMNRHNEITETYDFVKIGSGTNMDDKEHMEIIKEYKEVGVNWWIEVVSDWQGNTEELREIIKKGPGKL